MELATVAAIFDRCLGLFGLVKEGRIARDEQTDKALHLLFNALKETKIYVNSISEGQLREREREYQIAGYWEQASIPLRRIDSELARRCFEKGNYWLDPDSWNEAMVKKNRITLEQVTEDAGNLLGN